MEHLEYLKCYEFPSNKKFRLGCMWDGGYVCGDLESGYDVYISAGVANEESFSRDFITKYAMDKDHCFAFDGTIHDYPWQYTRNITFFKKCISPVNDVHNTNLQNILGANRNVFLKMDIESAEYDWLLSLPTDLIKNIKQAVIEFHGVNDNTWGVPFEKKLDCFKKMAETHYIIHIHGNNFSPYDSNGIPHTLELTFIRKNEFEMPLELNKTKLPIAGLDYPNNRNSKDLDLSMYPFVTVSP